MQIENYEPEVQEFDSKDPIKKAKYFFKYGQRLVVRYSSKSDLLVSAKVMTLGDRLSLYLDYPVNGRMSMLVSEKQLLEDTSFADAIQAALEDGSKVVTVNKRPYALEGADVDQLVEAIITQIGDEKQVATQELRQFAEERIAAIRARKEAAKAKTKAKAKAKPKSKAKAKGKKGAPVEAAPVGLPGAMSTEQVAVNTPVSTPVKPKQSA